MDARGILDSIFRHYKVIMLTIWILIAVCGATATIANFIANDSPKDTLIILNIAPTSAKVTLDGQGISGGSHSVEPGGHKITISADGFESKELSVEAKKDTTSEVSTFLIHKEQGVDYYKRSSSDISILRIIAKSNDEAAQIVANYDKWYSVTDALPLSTTYNVSGQTESVKINSTSGNGCRSELCLYVSGFIEDSERAKSKVAGLISEKGFNINDYEVIYAW